MGLLRKEGPKFGPTRTKPQLTTGAFSLYVCPCNTVRYNDTYQLVSVSNYLFGLFFLNDDYLFTIRHSIF